MHLIAGTFKSSRQRAGRAAKVFVETPSYPDLAKRKKAPLSGGDCLLFVFILTQVSSGKRFAEAEVAS